MGVLASWAQNLRYPSRYQPIERHLAGVHELLCQAHLPCEVLTDALLLSRLNRIDLAILPQTQVLAPATATALEAYLRAGGQVLILGAALVVAAADAVIPESPRFLGLSGEVVTRQVQHLEGEQLANLGQAVEPRVSVNAAWTRRDSEDGPGTEPLLATVELGQGRTCWLLAQVLTQWGGPLYDTVGDAPPVETLTAAPHPALRDLVAGAVREALGERWLLRSRAPAGVEFVVNQRVGDLYVHLVNHVPTGQPSVPGVNLFDGSPVLTGVAFEVRLPGIVTSPEVLLEETGLSWERADEVYRVDVARLVDHLAVRFPGAARG